MCAPNWGRLSTHKASRKWAVVSWLTGFYVVGMAVWLLARGLFFDRFWPLALINTAAEYLFWPLPFLLAANLWARTGRTLAALALPALTFLGLFGSLFLPPPFGPPEENSQPVKVMTFNVLFSNRNYEAIASAIRADSPDLIGLEELNPESAAALGEALAAEYPYNTFDLIDRRFGVGLLSRLPLVQALRFPLPPLNLSLHARVDWNGTAVQVFVVHLSPNNLLDYPIDQFVPLAIERYDARAGEVARLEKEIGALDSPGFLLCDCNMTETSETYASLAEVLGDSFREAGWGFGHTLRVGASPIPLQRVDYIWHTSEFEAVHSIVGSDGASDHLPVVSTFVAR